MQMTHWHSPRFHAYFPTAQSYPALLGDLLSGTLGCIGFSWIASPACTELEMKVLDWLADMLGLPAHFKFSSSKHGGGVIHGTASEATLVALLVARSKALNKPLPALKTGITIVDANNNEQLEQPAAVQQQRSAPMLHANDRHPASVDSEPSEPKKPTIEKLVGYCSDLAHSSVERAGLLGGVTIKSVPSDDDCRLRGDALRRQIEEDLEDGLVPFFVVATLGTTSVCTFDDLHEVGQVCRHYDLWLHVDAAYAGNSFVCPENRKFMRGIEVCTFRTLILLTDFRF